MSESDDAGSCNGSDGAQPLPLPLHRAMMHDYVRCGTNERLARGGSAVYGLDYDGHGHSDDMQGYVSEFHALVHGCDDYFSSAVRTSTNTASC
nr:unnamed protein product [Digitaria exilis]